jgi:hypothetical protein
MPTESPQPNVGADRSAGLRARFWMLVPVVGIGTGIGAERRSSRGAAEEHRPLAIATARDFVRPQGSWDG